LPQTIYKDLKFCSLSFNFKYKERGGILVKPYEPKIRIDFNPNNFRFDKKMQGERCTMMHDVTTTRKRKRTNNSNIGDFSRSLQGVDKL
jgi:hypothetical protein